jgi:hypothetical protein
MPLLEVGGAIRAGLSSAFATTGHHRNAVASIRLKILFFIRGWLMKFIRRSLLREGRLAVPAGTEVSGRGFTAIRACDFGAGEFLGFFEVLFDEGVGAVIVFGVNDTEGRKEIGDGDALGGREIFVFDEGGDFRSF